MTDLLDKYQKSIPKWKTLRQQDYICMLTIWF